MISLRSSFGHYAIRPTHATDAAISKKYCGPDASCWDASAAESPASRLPICWASRVSGQRLRRRKGRVIRSRIADVRATRRNTQGVRFMRLEEGERIQAIARVQDTDEVAGEVIAPEGEASEAPEAPETAE